MREYRKNYFNNLSWVGVSFSCLLYFLEGIHFEKGLEKIIFIKLFCFLLYKLFLSIGSVSIYVLYMNMATWKLCNKKVNRLQNFQDLYQFLSANFNGTTLLTQKSCFNKVFVDCVWGMNKGIFFLFFFQSKIGKGEPHKT